MNNAHAQFSQNSFPRRLHSPNAQQSRSDVRQDNPTPPTARTATPQPAPPKNDMRPTPKDVNTTSTQLKKGKKRKTLHLTLWVKPVVKAELERLAQEEGLSVSSVG